MLGITLQGFGHLNGQLARRRQDQRLRFGDGYIDFLQQGQGEGRCFAGAGLGFTQHIHPGQQGRDAGGLNGRGAFIAHFGECRKQCGFQPKLGKPNGCFR